MNNKNKIYNILYYVSFVLYALIILLSLKLKNLFFCTIIFSISCFLVGFFETLKTLKNNQKCERTPLFKGHCHLIVLILIKCISTIMLFYTHLLRVYAIQTQTQLSMVLINLFAVFSWVPAILSCHFVEKAKSKLKNQNTSYKTSKPHSTNH